ncbi:Cytochrome c-type biogenesis protein CcmH [wastewater metagenome]|uniref:Cytochrome c-type biogenesis protein CcmH n=4 Tax=root TaxID=1 RepID=A0A5B8R8A3_9ZZZZ|nr:cytochrome c-type biogenesis protein CcmH [uncultured organism]
MKGAVLAIVLILVTGAASAAGTVYEFDTPAQRERYTEIIGQLRCLVCQGQSIAESNADLAQDMRDKVHELILEGRDRGAIIGYMTDRYGDFVLYRPPVDPRTWLLWFGPLGLLVIAVAVLAVAVRRHRAAAGSPALSAGDHERARRLLSEGLDDDDDDTQGGRP